MISPADSVIAETPYYVLMDGNHRRLGPSVAQSSAKDVCAPIYGFSGKNSYDRFCRNCSLALTPYPLVPVYLRDQTATLDESLRLIVLDAAGPHEQCLYAATMESVLKAQENRTDHITAAYRLISFQESSDYRLEEAVI